MKIKRDSFLYLDPRPPVDSFAQCGTCLSWLSNKKCFILDRVVSADASCDMYLPGKADPNWLDARKIFTPEEVGLVTRQVRCENCISFNPKQSICNLFDKLNQAFPDIFDLGVNVNSRGCCNAQRPISKVNKAKSFSDIIKAEPDVGDVHVSTALSGSKKKPNDFSAFINPTNKPKPVDDPDVVLPKTDSVNKFGSPSSSISSATGGSTGYPRRQHLTRRRFSKAILFGEMVEMQKKAGALVGLAAAVNLAHSSTHPLQPKPKRLKYGSKTYKLDVKKKADEVKKKGQDLENSFQKLVMHLNAMGIGVD